MEDKLELDNAPEENKEKPDFTYLELAVQCLLFQVYMLLFLTVGY